MKRVLVGALLALTLGSVAAKAETYTQWPGWTTDLSTRATVPSMQFAYKSYTVATLPTCNAAAKGAQAMVSDATSPTYNASLTGGGAVAITVMCDGSAWKSH
jgi:hypothetical protein